MCDGTIRLARPYLRRVFDDTLGREMAAARGPAALDLRVTS